MTTTEAVDDLDDLGDRTALELSMQIARTKLGRAEQLNSMLRGSEFSSPRSWVEVAEFASYCCQCRALNLKPWQSPPCHADEDDANPRDEKARALLRRMLRAGVSRYDPDPMAALERKPKRR